MGEERRKGVCQYINKASTIIAVSIIHASFQRVEHDSCVLWQQSQSIISMARPLRIGKFKH